MCEFLSWYEVERNGRSMLLYLTDKEVYSEEGRERLAETKDNDILGHGAIRAYYPEIFADPTVTASAYEVRDFWKIGKLPAELAEKIKEFDQHWGRMFKSGAFQDDDIRYILAYAPKQYRVKALDRFFNPGSTLHRFVTHPPKQHGLKAWEELQWQRLPNSALCSLVLGATKKYRMLASAQLLRQKPSIGQLCWLMAYAPEEFKIKAWEKLSQRRLFRDHLCWIIAYAPRKYSAEASAQLLQRKCDRDDLHWIMAYAPRKYSAEASAQLLQRKCDRDDLRWIIAYAPKKYRVQAQKLLAAR